MEWQAEHWLIASDLLPLTLLLAGVPRKIFLGGTKPIWGLWDLQNYFEICKNVHQISEVLVFLSYETLC